MQGSRDLSRRSDVTEQQLRRTPSSEAYRDHADDVYRVAYAILRDPDAASDATHEAFARASRRWEQYDSNRPLRPWLHRIAARSPSTRSAGGASGPSPSPLSTPAAS